MSVWYEHTLTYRGVCANGSEKTFVQDIVLVSMRDTGS
jgi:hypothetical protein